MSKQKRRRQWRPADQLRIVRETLPSDGKLAAICRREGLSPNLVSQWRKQLLALTACPPTLSVWAIRRWERRRSKSRRGKRPLQWEGR
ncbi:MAG: transposase [Phycisphaerae bacterium]|nr:transposase [Phycisphaerae bacterium]